MKELLSDVLGSVVLPMNKCCGEAFATEAQWTAVDEVARWSRPSLKEAKALTELHKALANSLRATILYEDGIPDEGARIGPQLDFEPEVSARKCNDSAKSSGFTCFSNGSEVTCVVSIRTDFEPLVRIRIDCLYSFDKLISI